MGRSEDVARKIRIELEARGLHKEPVGVDVVEPPVLFALQKEGLNIVDGPQLLSDAREIKTQDEISLLTHSAAMVDAAYYELYRAMKPGMRENDAVALVPRCSTRAGRNMSKASTRFRPNAPARTRTCSRIA
jgi:Xaa-Pro aminopeptidase